MSSVVTVSGDSASAAMLTAPAVSQASQTYAVSQSLESDSGNSKREAVSQPVDTVTILSQVQDKKRVEAKTETLKDNSDKGKNNKQPEARSSSHVLFAYNAKGDLRIKFMDSGNNLIYQTPPVMFARMNDLMLQFKTSVDTNV